jgi:RNA polymerase sigma-70 factor, ECF subfamily
VIDAEMRGAHRELEARLRPFVARRVSSAADADDIIQEVFLRLLRGLPALREEERFGPWVYQVARNAITDHHRQQARNPLAHEDTLEIAEEPLDGGGEGGEDGAVAEQLALDMAPVVAQLPSPYREAITLTELQGMTQRAAADLLGVSLSGMKSRVQRGRAQLRDLLQACCEIALDARGRVIACEPRPASSQGTAGGCVCGSSGKRGC